MSNGNFSIKDAKWVIAPLLLGGAFVAVNNRFKLVDLDDRWTGCAGGVSGVALNLLFSTSRPNSPDETVKGNLYTALAFPFALYALQTYLIRNELSELRPYEWATPLTALAGGGLLNRFFGIHDIWVVKSHEAALIKRLTTDLSALQKQVDALSNRSKVADFDAEDDIVETEVRLQDEEGVSNISFDESFLKDVDIQVYEEEEAQIKLLAAGLVVDFDVEDDVVDTEGGLQNEEGVSSISFDKSFLKDVDIQVGEKEEK